MMQMRRYPVGIQTFSNIREEGYMYVDKTELIWQLANEHNYVFLSRPRRFGKSLLTSTLKSYFEGRKDLFEGLAIEQLEKDWTKYPVLHFDMSAGKNMDVEALNRYLDSMLRRYEKVYGEIPGDGKKEPNLRLEHLIWQANKQTGKRVVVLIDEYDAPMFDIMVDRDLFEQIRMVMKNFYIPLKEADPYLRFVFLTGITKHSYSNFYADLNNLENISMKDEYAAICGITREELLTQFDQSIEALAAKQELTKEETISKLTHYYGGYHLTKNSPELFNPFSLLLCFSCKEIKNYWYASGVTSYLIDMLKKQEITLSDIPEESIQAQAGFDVTIESYPNCGIIPMLWQTGYMSIKSYNKYSGNYKIGYPNKETKDSMALLLKSI